MRFLTVLAVILVVALPTPTLAQEGPRADVWRARAVELVSQATDRPEGTVDEPYQVWKAELRSGERKGETVEVVNDHLELAPGRTFFLNHVVDLEGQEWFQAIDVDRLPTLATLFVFFIAAILAFGGRQGLRSLLSLAGSFFVLMYLYLPRLAAGAPPIMTSIVTAVGILVLALYLTHGVKRHTHAAFLGTMATVTLTGLLAWASVALAELSGFSSEEAVYLNTVLGGTLDARGLLLGGVIIGIIGILDDIAVTQASVVAELRAAAPDLKLAQVYRRALHVGKEHVGALVNTLALAYAGAALPLLLLFTEEGTPPLVALNGEPVATEFIRTVVGSVGLILAVPLTTFIAVLLVRKEDAPSDGMPHVHRH